MKRTIGTLALILLLNATSVIGHHGYNEYDRNAAVTLEGFVKRVQWVNPHVVLTLETPNQGTYSIEWGAVFQLARYGLTEPPLKEGDRVAVTGSINKNPEKRILTLLREIHRPSDGWRWVNAANAAPAQK